MAFLGKNKTRREPHGLDSESVQSFLEEQIQVPHTALAGVCSLGSEFFTWAADFGAQKHYFRDSEKLAIPETARLEKEPQILNNFSLLSESNRTERQDALGPEMVSNLPNMDEVLVEAFIKRRFPTPDFGKLLS